ncbi:MAG: SpoIIE family protein phosphatase, partial [Ignavibacteria bacterium]|nr:SpoIIE family protein phosphatase [Ignavibacteria bacterium]
FQSTTKKLRDLFGILTSDISTNEIRQLVTKDAAGYLSFYAKYAEEVSVKSRTIRYLKLAKNLFIAFLLKLNPARRFIYLVVLFIFLWGWQTNIWFYVLIGFIGINILLAFELADKLIMRNELEVARDVQISALPQEPPENEFYDIAFFYETAQEVGGDYLDFSCDPTDNKLKHIIIGDVSGKGLGAALYMLQIKAAFHLLGNFFQSPTEILSQLNCELYKKIKVGNFFTASILSLNEEGNFIFARAGHLPLYKYTRSSHGFEFFQPKGIGIGLSNQTVFNINLEEIFIESKSEDIFVLFTDGLIESRNTFEREFGEDKLKNVITKYSHLSSKEIKNGILTELKRFIGENNIFDDATVIVLKRK